MSGQRPAPVPEAAPRPVPDVAQRPVPEAVQRRVRVAARALGRHGLAHAYGHVSERLDAQQLLVCAPRPMGLIRPGEPGTVVTITGALPEGVLGEVRLHQQIYRRRPEVHAVLRAMPPALMALGTARRVPQPRHGQGSYFGPDGPALWDDPQLLRNDAAAAAVADTLGQRAAIVMRGNGVVVAAATLAQAVSLCWYLEDAARLELAVLGAGLADSSVVLNAAECAQRATAAGGIFERFWQFLTDGDPEADPAAEPA